jgi:beta-galactosidase
MNPRMALLRIFATGALLLGAARHAQAAEAAGDGRRLINLDPGWRFMGGDAPGAPDAGFDDSTWQPVDLPHTWNGLDGEDGGDNYRRGAGWYRRHLALDASLAGRRLYLQFDGASLMADVYVNGVHVGNHKGGFARFRFDATSALKPGADNVIAVRVDNGRIGIPPTSSDFTIFGGLYRGVWLLATDPVQVSVMDMGSPGVFIEQIGASPGVAGIMVRAELENHNPAPCDVAIRLEVLDPSLGLVTDSYFQAHLDAGGSTEVVKRASIEHPHLWDGRSDPYLYKVRLELRAFKPGELRGGVNTVKGPPCDAVEQPLGLRTFSVDPDRGFILNGHYLDLHGFNRHQDWPDKGWAISDAEEAEDFAIMLESGATAVRTSHYQDSESWYDRCDRGGIAVWTEIPNWQKGLETAQYLESARQQMRELIRQNFNHPSIFFWGVGNETSGPAADSVAAAGAAVVREEDPGRLSTYASNHDAADTKNWHTDVVAFNRYYGWYRGDISDFVPFLDKTRADYPRARFGMSEFGAGASIYQHSQSPTRPEARGPYHPEEYQSLLHEAYWAALKGRPYVWGKFIWCLFDFASDGRNEGDHAGRNDKGLVTYDRKVKKDAFYFYKANWSGDPVVHVTGSRAVLRTDPVTEVKVYSNAPEVTLEVNGVALGSQFDPGGTRIFRWEGVRLAAGENRVVARARFGASAVTDACAWTLKTP